MVGALGTFCYLVYLYFTYFNGPQFTRFPEPVARALRKALYFSNQEPDPGRALKYYRQALELCDEEGLDHFSDEVMGIKIQIAAWLEKIESYQNAITVLENLLSDCRRWVEAMEKSEREGTLPHPHPAPPPPEGVPVPEKPRETWRGKRTRILAKAVTISVKLADLYSDEHVLERELAHERLVWAVETSLRETQRRAKEGLKEGEGDWMKGDEIGGGLEGELLLEFPIFAAYFARSVMLTWTCSAGTQLPKKEPVSSRPSALFRSPQAVPRSLSHCSLK